MKVTIGKKITGGFLLLNLLFVSSALINIISLNSSRSVVNENSTVLIPSVRALDEFRLMVTRSKMLSTNWVYLQASDQDKQELKKLHNIDYPMLKEKLKNLAEQWEDASQKSSLDSLFEEFEGLLEIEKGIMSNLVTFENYEDPMTKLLSEDEIESSVLPITASIMHGLTNLSGQKENEASNRQQDLIEGFEFLVNLMIIIGVVVVIVGLLAGILLSRAITNPISYLKNIISGLSKGELPEEGAQFEFPKDEVGDMGESVYTLVNGLRSTSDFAEKIGKGKYDYEFEALSENDTLGNALLDMRENLKSVAEEDKKRNWSVTGQAKFGEILRHNQEDVKALGDQVISELVKYMQANQGSLFIINNDNEGEEYLELVSCYAWDRKKHLEEKISKGQGLTGQAWLEGDVIYLTELPEDFIKITSGLGESTPTCVIIQPLAVNDEIFGVVELALFRELEEYEREFLTKIAESIASTVSGVSTTQKTKILLEQSQQQTEEMRAQEEEMRQNQEELQATQEEMERQKSELQEEILQLKQQLEPA